MNLLGLVGLQTGRSTQPRIRAFNQITQSEKKKHYCLYYLETSGILFFLRGFFGLTYLDNPLPPSFVLLDATLIIKELVFLQQNNLKFYGKSAMKIHFHQGRVSVK